MVPAAKEGDATPMLIAPTTLAKANPMLSFFIYVP
jgi:hypothetical protein